MTSSRPSVFLLVDGYNVIGAWASLKQTYLMSGLEDARRTLVEVLVNYSSYQHFDTRIVFDAYAQNKPGEHEHITQNLSIQFTDAGQTADSYIEKTCAVFHKHNLRRTKRLIVATSDRAQQRVVTGYGAEWISALLLEADVRLARTNVLQKKSSYKRKNGNHLANTLDKQVQDKLTRLRFGME